MPIHATRPTVIEAGATFDRVAVSQFVNTSITPRGIRTSILLRLQRYRELPDGSCQADPGGPVVKSIQEAFAEADSDPAFAEAFAACMAAVGRYIAAKGLI